MLHVIYFPSIALSAHVLEWNLNSSLKFRVMSERKDKYQGHLPLNQSGKIALWG